MYCPQCGTDSTSNVQYCRSCGANLKVIGKAVSLSEAIARSDRGPLPKIREMVKGLKVDQVTDEVSKALERMNNEIASISPKQKPDRTSWISLRKKKTPQERREEKDSLLPTMSWSNRETTGSSPPDASLLSPHRGLRRRSDSY